jgi:serine/threonine protein kinase
MAALSAPETDTVTSSGPSPSKSHTAKSNCFTEADPVSTSISAPQLARRPQSSTAGNRPRHISLGRKELLGKGTFGMVYRAMDLDTNRIIAVKEVTIAPGSMRPEQLATLRREIAMMQKLDHPNIVKYLGEHWDGQQHLRIFMEYVAGGTVSSLLRSFGPATEQQASRYARQILEGLRYLHDQRIAHRDLKGENLLVDVDGTLKLADFGTAKELATQTKSVAGTAFFMAPEVIRGVGHGIEADVWSAGCCVVEMLSGKPPFAGFSNQYAIMMHIAELKDGTFPIPDSVSPLGRDFLNRCLRADPGARSTVTELLQHEWILNPPSSHDLHSINLLSASDSQTAVVAGDGAAEKSRPTSAEDRKTDSFNPIQSYGPESPTV